MRISLHNIVKSFGNFTALKGLDLEVSPGELVALLGPSGSGKTTLLRIIAGLDQADRGEVLFDGADAAERRLRDRRVGFVFQHYALFRHMSVFENVAFGLRVKPSAERQGEAEIRARVERLLDLVQLTRLAKRYPNQLSGGQRQRVALARALAIEPKVLLLDEPFGALDAKVRKELRRWLRRLHDEMRLTSVFVTHDQEEALELADRVVVMNEGRIEQIGSPETVYDQPASPFVYEFLGNVNRFECRSIEGSAEVLGNSFRVPALVARAGGSAIAYVRPHDIEVMAAGSPGAVAAVVRHISAAGPLTTVEFQVGGREAMVEAAMSRARFHELGLKIGADFAIKARRAKLFPRAQVEPA